MTLTRNVNGEQVEMSPEEEVDFNAESDANQSPVYQQLAGQIQGEGLLRIKDVFPSLGTLDEVQFFAELWKSIAPAARKPTVDFQKSIDIYTAAKQAIAVVEGFTTQAEVDAYDIITDPGWPS